MAVGPITCLVEGLLDEAVVRRVLSDACLEPTVFYHRSLPRFEADLKRFNQAAVHNPWFALCDLDRDECVPNRLQRFLPSPAPGMCFRIAVRSSESWLMADRLAIADFIGISVALVPTHPETEVAPKNRMIALARRSRRRAIRHGMVPVEGDSRAIGPEYTLMLAEYARDRWSPRRASGRAPSLRRALERCDTIARTGHW